MTQALSLAHADMMHCTTAHALVLVSGPIQHRKSAPPVESSLAATQRRDSDQLVSLPSTPAWRHTSHAISQAAKKKAEETKAAGGDEKKEGEEDTKMEAVCLYLPEARLTIKLV